MTFCFGGNRHFQVGVDTLAVGPVGRAEFIDYLWRYKGKPESAGVCTFTDVPADHEYILAEFFGRELAEEDEAA